MAENKNAQQVREITDKLEQGIKELFESERFKEYLRTMSKFYNYSFNNTLLIAMQKPEATYVAGYTSWQRNFDRQVMKGEKGIKILAPAPYKAQEEREKIDPLTQKPVIGADGKGCEVYRLYSDNTEGLCVDAKEIADHATKGGMLGISKESWMAALEKENYLKAAEMSMEDDYGMIDGIINNGPKEDKTAEVKAPERGEKSSIMDRLKSAKAEKQKECCPPKKHKGEIEL